MSIKYIYTQNVDWVKKQQYIFPIGFIIRKGILIADFYAFAWKSIMNLHVVYRLGYAQMYLSESSQIDSDRWAHPLRFKNSVERENRSLYF